MKRLLRVLCGLMIASSLSAVAQNAGFDLFQTGSGTTADLGSPIGTVNLQGIPIQGTLGNTDTIVQRTQNGPGQVPATVYALSMKSTNPITFNGQSADVYVTINNSGGAIPTTALPQPDTLSPSTGTVTISVGGTFNSSIAVNADVILVKAGTSIGNPSNILGHQPAPMVSLTSTNSSWSASAPSGYPSNSNFPSGGFFVTSINGGHVTPTHAHVIIPASCSRLIISNQTGNQTSQQAKKDGGSKTGAIRECLDFSCCIAAQ